MRSSFFSSFRAGPAAAPITSININVTSCYQVYWQLARAALQRMRSFSCAGPADAPITSRGYGGCDGGVGRWRWRRSHGHRWLLLCRSWLGLRRSFAHGERLGWRHITVLFAIEPSVVISEHLLVESLEARGAAERVVAVLDRLPNAVAHECGVKRLLARRITAMLHGARARIAVIVHHKLFARAALEAVIAPSARQPVSAAVAATPITATAITEDVYSMHLCKHIGSVLLIHRHRFIIIT